MLVAPIGTGAASVIQLYSQPDRGSTWSLGKHSPTERSAALQECFPRQHSLLLAKIHQEAYGFPSTSTLDGSGQTIVIVDAFGSPTIASDLALFDARFGIPAPPSFTIFCGNSATPLDPTTCPNVNIFANAFHGEFGWTIETSLDVEYAHAMAPGANIVLDVAATSSGNAITQRKLQPLPSIQAQYSPRASVSQRSSFTPTMDKSIKHRPTMRTESLSAIRFSLQLETQVQPLFQHSNGQLPRIRRAQYRRNRDAGIAIQRTDYSHAERHLVASLQNTMDSSPNLLAP